MNGLIKMSIAYNDPIFVLLGFAVGIMVGLTGMGGAVLMTPALIFLGVPIEVAIGTDLAYAATTKLLGSILHHKKGNVDFKLAFTIFAGSFPGAIVGGLILYYLKSRNIKGFDLYLSLFLGIVLIVSSIVMLYGVIKGIKPSNPENLTTKQRWKIVLIGFFIGMIVQFTSVGSGTLLIFFLIAFTGLSPSVVVGTDIFHGLLLTATGSIIHARLGNIDYQLAAFLILGTIPGTFIGATMNPKIPKKTLTIVLILMVMVAGILIIFKSLSGPY